MWTRPGQVYPSLDRSPQKPTTGHNITDPDDPVMILKKKFRSSKTINGEIIYGFGEP